MKCRGIYPATNPSPAPQTRGRQNFLLREGTPPAASNNNNGTYVIEGIPENHPYKVSSFLVTLLHVHSQ